MGTLIGAPFIPPDDTLLSTSTSGELQLKPGTRGDILLAGVGGVWAVKALGATGEYLKSDGTDVVYSAPPGEGWALIETMNPSGATTVTTAAMAARTEYLVRLTSISTSSNANIIMRFNGDTGATYQAEYTDGVTDSTASGTSILIWAPGASFALESSGGMIQIQGKTRAVASGRLHGTSAVAFGTGGGFTYSFFWAGGNATQISTITFAVTGGTYSGKIEVYGRTANA